MSWDTRDTHTGLTRAMRDRRTCPLEQQLKVRKDAPKNLQNETGYLCPVIALFMALIITVHRLFTWLDINKWYNCL